MNEKDFDELMDDAEEYRRDQSIDQWEDEDGEEDEF